MSHISTTNEIELVTPFERTILLSFPMVRANMDRAHAQTMLFDPEKSNLMFAVTQVHGRVCCHSKFSGFTSIYLFHLSMYSKHPPSMEG